MADPTPLISPPIPLCEDNFYVKLPCYDFIWSGNESERIRSIVAAIMANNPGRPIPSIKVKSFKTEAEVDEWLYRNPMYCYGALHFMERNSSVISYGIQTNSTLLPKRGKFEDPTFKFLIPLQIAAEREISRSLIGVQNFSWAFGFKEFAHPPQNILLGMNTAGSPFSMSSVGPPFFLAIVMFGFVFQMTSLVTEKELKLRQAMTLMGLYDSAYWFSWLFVGVFGFPYMSKFSKLCQIIWSFFPPNLLAKALWLLSDATSSPEDVGISWSGRAMCTPNDEYCVITIIRGLVKTYPGTTKTGCFKCKKTPPYHALNFDIQWDALSGLEHLHLFARIKGLPLSSIDSVIEKSLAEVRLTKAAKVRVGSYSGGMKRRLSVAVALIGDPKLVILDEPTTGMDPIARRHVWDIIKKAKKGRAIVLTTHSMEEAEILSDRIGIMANGRLRCIGTSVRLKSRFGTGFVININFNRQTPTEDVAHSTRDHEAVKQFFKHIDFRFI
ncbi:hypothetical protein F8388_004977 [Cannabis sativa]|uniref:ABC transporter domain-containing protein n=1 Tax=Cannabis sativa TaxID=3483 RepID=A0A7J6FZ54_CANSA|nr:hypothetical protein F8388_004977 [Cannabis sativa]